MNGLNADPRDLPGVPRVPAIRSSQESTGAHVEGGCCWAPGEPGSAIYEGNGREWVRRPQGKPAPGLSAVQTPEDGAVIPDGDREFRVDEIDTPQNGRDLPSDALPGPASVVRSKDQPIAPDHQAEARVQECDVLEMLCRPR